jgi:hypothetical protein
VLLTQPFVMVQRKGHLRGTGALDLETYPGLRHVVASPLRGPVRGYMDEYLEQPGYRRNVVLSVPQFGMVPEVLKRELSNGAGRKREPVCGAPHSAPGAGCVLVDPHLAASAKKSPTMRLKRAACSICVQCPHSPNTCNCERAIKSNSL